ncbi:hypothetical protein AXX17_AT4G09010 [Arabidopsis thaliana]|uniref:Uncharacterized protein n=1 Tax=Arabidopsis thaliana TaxID=3702 RepID=A0A178V4I2_ARATH|nr:hypothetical protein AXX17_AT4G09010 [Arabidopsis thaliana]
MCDERQRSGLKRQMLEARIACVERNVRAQESDPFQWEWRNFDSVAKIPTMLWMYLHNMDFNLWCSESMPNFSIVGIMDGDIPNEPERGPSPSPGFFRSQIQTPCALIKGLPERDQELTMAFVMKLTVRHQKFTLERRKLRKKVHQMGRWITKI